MVYECSNHDCFYSIDVFCDGENKSLIDEADEKIELRDGWYVVFKKIDVEQGVRVEAEILYNNTLGYLQLINIKAMSNRKLELPEINELRKRLCEQVKGSYNKK